MNMNVFAVTAECWYQKTEVLAGIGGFRAASDLRFRAIRPGKRGFLGSYLSAIRDRELVALGDNRDGQRQHEQMVIGLICNPGGCPVGVEVFAGNTQDASIVPDKIRQIQQRYGIKKLIFVGDRGRVTPANYEKVKDWEGLWTISALTPQQILDRLERKLITPELFDERKVVEVLDPAPPIA